MSGTAQTVLLTSASTLITFLLHRGVSALWARCVERPHAMAALIRPQYQALLGANGGARRARQVSRILARRDFLADHFIPAYFFRFAELRTWSGAEAIAALHAVGVPNDRAAEESWLRAFGGPREDGAPLAAYQHLTIHPDQWARWVRDMGGPDLVLAAITAGFTPAEVTEGVAAGTLTPDTVAFLTALR